MSGLYWRFLSWAQGAMLVHMARLAARRGDRHELRHIGAQMDAGDTTDCKPDECPLWLQEDRRLVREAQEARRV